MRDDLRERREDHLLYVRLGLPFKERCRRLAEEYGVSVNAVEKDDGRMDQWVDDIANTASFEKKASFLLYQHRSQTEETEILARNARQERRASEERLEELQEQKDEIQERGPEEFESVEEYWNMLLRLYRQIDSTESDIFKWQREERQERQTVADMTQDEFELRQSMGEIEEAAEELHIREEREVTERKLIAGVDITELPGLEKANIVGADLDLEEDAEEIEVTDPHE